MTTLIELESGKFFMFDNSGYDKCGVYLKISPYKIKLVKPFGIDNGIKGTLFHTSPHNHATVLEFNYHNERYIIKI